MPCSVAVKISLSSTTLMCDSELRCQCKQREVGLCWPAGRGRCLLCLQLVSSVSVRAVLSMVSILKQLLVPQGTNTSTGPGSAQPELDLDSHLKGHGERVQDLSETTLTTNPQSPLPESEYDKLLVSRRGKK